MRQRFHEVNQTSKTYQPNGCWAIRLSQFETVWHRLPLQKFLLPTRLNRVRSFHDQKDRIRTAGAEIWVRLLLSSMMNQTPLEIDITFGTFKKPRLNSLNKKPCFYFNIAHAGDWIVVAISDSGEVGIDVEKTSHMSPDLYDVILAGEEQKLIQKRLDSNTKETLTHYWVGKEAFTKLAGQGLSMPVKEIIIREIEKLSNVKYQTKSTRCWLQTGKLDPSHCWALATYSQHLTLEMTKNIIFVDEDSFQKMLQSYLGDLLVQ